MHKYIKNNIKPQDNNAYIETSMNESFDKDDPEFYSYDYSIDDIDKLDGVFILRSDMKTLTALGGFKWNEFPSSGMKIDQYKLIEEGTWYIFSESTPIQLKAGEKIVLIGSEGASLARNGVIFARNCNVIGYGNVYETTNMHFRFYG